MNTIKDTAYSIYLEIRYADPLAIGTALGILFAMVGLPVLDSIFHLTAN